MIGSLFVGPVCEALRGRGPEADFRHSFEWPPGDACASAAGAGCRRGEGAGRGGRGEESLRGAFRRRQRKAPRTVPHTGAGRRPLRAGTILAHLRHALAPFPAPRGKGASSGGQTVRLPAGSGRACRTSAAASPAGPSRHRRARAVTGGLKPPNEGTGRDTQLGAAQPNPDAAPRVESVMHKRNASAPSAYDPRPASDFWSRASSGGTGGSATPIYDTVCALWRLQNRELPRRPEAPGRWTDPQDLFRRN
jgi:hypothetical protein